MITLTTLTTVAGYVAAEGADGSLVWGIGATEAAALADATAQGAAVPLTVVPASADLLRAVSTGGGALEWAVWDGVAYTLAASDRR
jgi:hypothetical protein